jgi:geranylgeranyl pyrophosphate synthase
MNASRGFTSWLLRRNRPIIRIQRQLASSAFAEVSDSLRESVKSSVKATLLKTAGDHDSILWRNDHNQVNGSLLPDETGVDIDQPISSSLNDPLDDLYLKHVSTRYWPKLPSSVSPNVDPFALAKIELDSLSASIRQDLVGTDHPVLNQAASYFFESSADGGKKVRPMMVMLLSRALAETEPDNISNNAAQLFTPPMSWQRPDLPQAQRRLAEISEMIHTASLFHDDVIDGADTRRGVPAVHMIFGNKMAILAGDYLLARASICLARLRNVHVVETMSTIIEHLVRGEVMQMRGSEGSDSSRERIVYYLRKNFYKTGSLMANSCKSAALLGDYSPDLVDASYRFGKHVGMAFQLVDDVLDYEGSLKQLGKPALADLKAGLATAPVLFAAEEYPAVLEPLIDRKFKEDGDAIRAVEYVNASNGMERTKELARVHAELAMDAILELEPSEYRDSLVHLAYKVVARTK